MVKEPKPETPATTKADEAKKETAGVDYRKKMEERMRVRRKKKKMKK